ncbi:hypothetical protein QBC38DRAFT_465204 [Podospora fimiseda]|uniref:Uncharacterized protein n=1 Tax=Podospora fimiseda TaxID=252190 RepID=A0AAN7BXU6_9PEZI|nr:hypothetical protein QBC38DRAFT_465204 [Podospora fimiseda]
MSYIEDDLLKLTFATTAPIKLDPFTRPLASQLLSQLSKLSFEISDKAQNALLLYSAEKGRSYPNYSSQIFNAGISRIQSRSLILQTHLSQAAAVMLDKEATWSDELEEILGEQLYQMERTLKGLNGIMKGPERWYLIVERVLGLEDMVCSWSVFWIFVMQVMSLKTEDEQKEKIASTGGRRLVDQVTRDATRAWTIIEECRGQTWADDVPVPSGMDREEHDRVAGEYQSGADY